MKNAECQAELAVRDPYGEIKPLERVEVWEARMTLGVYLAPSGSDEKEFQHLMEKALAWRDRIWTGHLPRHASWHSMLTTILKTLEYPLGVTCFSRD